MAAGGNRDGEKRGWRSQADSGFLGLRPADLGGSRSEVAAAAGPQKQEARLEEARRGAAGVRGRPVPGRRPATGAHDRVRGAGLPVAWPCALRPGARRTGHPGSVWETYQ